MTEKEDIPNSNELHIWMIQTSEKIFKENFTEVLSPNELKRATDFKYKKDFKLFILRRFALRKILAKYTSKEAKDIQILYSHQKKPFIECCPSFSFNISHSNSLSVLLIGKCKDIGIDVENVKPLSDLEFLINSMGSFPEITRFKKLPKDKQLDFFYEVWTKKEAFVKSIGVGLFFPLKKVSVLHQQPILSNCLKTKYNNITTKLYINRFFNDHKENKFFKISYCSPIKNPNIRVKIFTFPLREGRILFKKEN